MMLVCRIGIVLSLLTMVVDQNEGFAQEFGERVEHSYATNPTDDTRIHYVSVGTGPLVVFVHGFPDFWYSWSEQMQWISSTYRCVAMDLRGYNRSDKPEKLESYDMTLLVEDVITVIKACDVK